MSGWMKIARAILTAVLFIGIGLSSSPLPASAAGGEEPTLPPLELIRNGNPKLDSRLNQMVAAMPSSGISSFALANVVEPEVETVRVIVEALPGQLETAREVARAFGTVETDYDNLLQVVVQVAQLNALANSQSVHLVRTPLQAVPETMSEGVPVINANLWQSANLTGAGVKIGIIDGGFYGYADLLGTELPASVATLWAPSIGGAGTSEHGTGCVEIIYDIAPDAQFYLANIDTEVDLGNAVDWMIAQGVKVISHSMGWFATGPGNGTGPIDEIVDTARAAGILWVNAAGNSAQRHWSGTFNDPDSDTWNNFTPSDETNPIYASAGTTITIILKWDDTWTAPTNDYDLYLYRESDAALVRESENDQSGHAYPYPRESLTYVVPTTGWYDILIRKYSATRDVVFHLYTFNQVLQYSTATGSLLEPADSPNALAVGAVRWSTSALETFSSQGPTADNRTKPDLVAPDGVSTVAYSPGSFLGTSASAPHVAGAAALVKQLYPSSTPAQLQAKLEGWAVDLGAAGKDNLYGSGRLYLENLPPAVTSNNATNITAHSTRLNGNLTSLGVATSANVSFQWGTASANYTAETAAQSKNAIGAFSYDLSSLLANTTYYFRAKAAGYDTDYGDEKSVTTLSTSAPTVITDNATNVTHNSSRLNGNLTALGSATSANVSFQWGTTTGTYTANTTTQLMDSTGVFYYDLAGLSANTTYYFRAKAVGEGTSYGEEKSFTTLPTSPLVTTDNATSVTANSTQLNGNLTALGSATSANVSFQWGTSSGNYTAETATSSMNSTGSFSASLNGLSPKTNYYFRAKAIGDGTGYGAEKSFTTLSLSPSVVTDNASSVSFFSARLSGNLTALGSATSANVSFQWGISSGNYTAQTAAESMNITGTYYYDLGSLSANTTYYFRAKAAGDGSGYGEEKSFTTLPTSPGVTTDNATPVPVPDPSLTRVQPSTNVTQALVTRIIDGDTFEVKISGATYRVRYIGMDTPELNDQQPAISALAQEAKKYNRQLVEGRTVILEKDISETDQFGRLLRYVYVGDLFVNAELVRLGYAQAATYPPDVKYQSFFLELQVEAETAGIGLWATPPSSTRNMMRLRGDIASFGTASSANVSFQWGSVSGNYTAETATETANTTGTFYANLSGLSGNLTYYYRAKAVGDGTGYGSERSFILLPGMETIAEAQGKYYRQAPVLDLGFTSRALDSGWYQTDNYSGNWTALFGNIIGTAWNGTNWVLPGFTALSDGSHTIYFKASDDYGQMEGESGEWSWWFYKDTTPPTNPTSLNSTSHSLSIWSSDNTVAVSWLAATDNLSGLDGYSIVWDTSNTTVPDQTRDIGDSTTNITSPALSDGINYFHIRSVDKVDNFASYAVHLGPFFIDTAPPTIQSIAESPGGYYNTAPVLAMLGFEDSAALDDGWYQIDSYSENWTTLFSNNPGNAVATSNWVVPGFAALSEGSHTLYFKASDDIGHIEGESGEWSWQFYKDTVAPSAVSNLTAGTVTTNSIQLRWTARGNNADNGTAATYDIRYSTADITADNWSSAIQFTGEPVPSAAGSNETFTGSGLSAGATYYFALKTADQANNWSEISNVVRAATSSPPAEVGGSGGFGFGGVIFTLPANGLNGTGPIINAVTGTTLNSATLETTDGDVSIGIAAGTKMLDKLGFAVNSISATPVETPPEAPPDSTVILSYELGPSGAQFNPPLTLTLAVDPKAVPAEAPLSLVYIAYWNGTEWIKLDSIFDLAANTVTAQARHFTEFAVIAETEKVPATPPATISTPVEISLPPPPVVEPEPIPTTETVAPAVVETTVPATIVASSTTTETVSSLAPESMTELVPVPERQAFNWTLVGILLGLAMVDAAYFIVRTRRRARPEH
ncbi:MAG: S8 family serine peptidase [Chloroflexi bacterium]|nr:S8 family serine peptidase [Chloroflexota bacterium]